MSTQHQSSEAVLSLSHFQFFRRVVLGILIIIAFMILLFVRSAGGQERHDLVEAIGLSLIVIGIVGRMWCTLYIGGRKSVEIVEFGPYSVTRNPLYVFSSIAAAGVGAQTGSLILTAFFFIACAGAFHVVIRREERFLEGTFGETYRIYCSRVPRFWPAPRLYRDQATLTVSTRRIYSTFGDGLIFFVAKPAFEAVEYFQDAGTIPIALLLF
ncbi:methyltransferase family protein [Microvirga sp. M2]|uniref:methyltransferase family protein n=1 Tax=Microvirga sp. M2 TaxID=3073270 RepID=UPI0039C31EC9